MKTISDIKENVELLHTMNRNARMETEKKYKQKIFAYYDDVQEIKTLLSDLENVRNGDYRFDEFGDFVYSIEVPKEIRELPEIGDYLTRDFGLYKDGTLSQFLGGPITINYFNRDSYFVYDHETGKPIIKERPSIEGHPEISEEEYLKAKIELYQRERGVFSDVVETDYYGGYLKHFSLDGNADDETLKDIVNRYEDNETEVDDEIDEKENAKFKAKNNFE